MAKVWAVVDTTRKFFATDYHAKVPTFRIASLAANWAANFLALMLLTLLQLIAHAFAAEIINAVHLLLSHVLPPEVIRIVDFVAGELSFCLVADTALVDQLLTKHAFIIVALFDALVTSTWQELFTQVVAHGYRLNTTLSLAAKKTLDCLVAGWAIDLAGRILLARLAFACMADLLAVVMPTV